VLFSVQSVLGAWGMGVGHYKREGQTSQRAFPIELWISKILIFLSGLQDANKNNNKKVFLLITFLRYLYIILHSSTIKSHKGVTKQ
jgi:hypothetical protein